VGEASGEATARGGAGGRRGGGSPEARRRRCSRARDHGLGCGWALHKARRTANPTKATGRCLGRPWRLAPRGGGAADGGARRQGLQLGGNIKGGKGELAHHHGNELETAWALGKRRWRRSMSASRGRRRRRSSVRGSVQQRERVHDDEKLRRRSGKKTGTSGRGPVRWRRRASPLAVKGAAAGSSWRRRARERRAVQGMYERGKSARRARSQVL
jgi:hypothetical protein